MARGDEFWLELDPVTLCFASEGDAKAFLIDMLKHYNKNYEPAYWRKRQSGGCSLAGTAKIQNIDNEKNYDDGGAEVVENIDVDELYGQI